MIYPIFPVDQLFKLCLYSRYIDWTIRGSNSGRVGIPLFKHQKPGHLITFRWHGKKGGQKTKFLTGDEMGKKS